MDFGKAKSRDEKREERRGEGKRKEGKENGMGMDGEDKGKGQTKRGAIEEREGSSIDPGYGPV